MSRFIITELKSDSESWDSDSESSDLDSESSDSDSESSDSDLELKKVIFVFLLLQLITIISWNLFFEGAI